jgi:hypothetical protein
MWRTHPASSAFVAFSPTEAARLDGISLVKKGSTIAFRLGQCSTNALAASFAPDHSYVQYGEVVHADTYQREWLVRSHGSKGGVLTVKETDLAGIEDAVKLRCVLAYCPAPETSSELEECLTTASVGHLILALRWCHNAFRLNDESLLSDSLVDRLSELLAAFVAQELSIHRKIGSQRKLRKSEYVALIANQVLDLFGVESTSDSPSLSPRCLSELLSADALAVVREQLHRELFEAENNYEADVQRSPYRLS